ncbi:MAG: glycosyltransferase family 39 protein [Acidobacteriota bacterium]|nr:glycosyltransferase family 39 protein [Acidobacteriota bacterium]
MNNKLLAIISSLIVVVVAIVTFPVGFSALLVCLVPSILAVAIIQRYATENATEEDFLIRVFLIGLMIRISFATFLHVFEIRTFFGEDSVQYDILGNTLANYWWGTNVIGDAYLNRAVGIGSPGWGMNYLIGAIYFLVGRNPFAAQLFITVFGAFTSVLIYICSKKIFNNQRVAKIAALTVALCPSLIIWSSNILKDGLIIFLLALVMVNILFLMEKLRYEHLFMLVLAMCGILFLRFYIFYMVAVSVGGSFLVGTSNSVKSIIGRTFAIVVIGISLTYFGAVNLATADFETYGNLERVQISRDYLASSANSGYGSDTDVSTTGAAILALPLGFVYLMLAPFPWQVSSFRQAITLPEMMVWWASIPLLVTGLWYTIKHRLRNAIAVLLFTLMLTISYSLFQGNVGTAYRQRAQIQVFLFIFISVGWTLLKEKKENKRIAKITHQQRLNQRIQSRV